MAKGKDCVITVWLALSLAVITGLFLALLESANTAGTAWYLDLAARSAADSLFADYHRELWDRYRVFGLEEYAEEETRQEYFAYLSPYTDPEKNKSWTNVTIAPEDVCITETKTLLSESGEPLREEILSYMKTAWIAQDSEARDAEEILERAQKERLSEDVSEWIGGMNETAGGMAEYSIRICREADFLRKGKSLLMKTAETGDWPGFSERAAEMRESAERILSFSGGCKKASERYDAETAAHREDAADTKELRQKLDALSQSAHRILRDLDDAEELSAEAQREEDAAEESDDFTDGGIREEVIRAVEALPVPEEYWSERKGDPEKLAAIRNAGAILSGRLLDVVLPEGASVSEEKIFVPEAPSQGAGISPGAAAYVLTDRLLLSEYVLRMTERYEAGMTGSELQAEYVAYGKESDREDLSAAVAEAMAIRTGEGLAALLSDAQKRKEAEALSAAVTGGMPGTMEAMTFFLLALWAAWQAAADAKTVLSDGKVPAWRSGSMFTVSLSGILAGDLSQESEETGLSLRDCLRILLLMHLDDAAVLRLADVMQHELLKEQEDFRMQRMTAKLTAVVSARSVRVFSLGGTYETRTAVTRAYY